MRRMEQTEWTDRTDPRNRCCCNIHVVKGATIIAIVGMVIAVLSIVGCILAGRYFQCIGFVLAIFLYATVLYAQHVRNPGLYWPYLVVNGISIGICSLYILLLLAMFVVMPAFWQRHLNETTNYQYQEAINKWPRVITGLAAAFMLLCQVVNIWFELVVYNAYCFIRRDQPMLLNNAYKA
ncbi:hypothetical protein Ddc_11345 [Ditylenchus destructor]|uniref:Uncharacterized protein n=1 Tax=Ditylenchus destructor TaxID=166010 RepID=A0AAD4R7C5_9BILA|nr:hypothetical protein Ddc_11345 [Ditylenchus destructor]KAI1714912.1 hypothetical protein DdX_08184 [Ditylenchus destructor]